MDPRAAHLITLLGLEPHPEGGFYRQIYRSTSAVQPDDGRGSRTALTTIYFLLPAGDVSRWHVVASDEVWHFYEGDALELLSIDEPLARIERRVLGPVGDSSQPVHVVPAHQWQAARSTGRYTLVGCTVGPGFDFADFVLARDRPTVADEIRRRHPEGALFI